ncbi:MAG: type II toxin-antitoxin system VapC family toxin [Candidatus Lokiarchaeota archaeon]|nr:type II toxin-antitoxin system VapC family toxin [Candidatus Lokiarchaeota archaeon]
MIFIDTNIAIEILNGNNTLDDLITKLSSDKIGITSPYIVELYYSLYKLKYIKKELSKSKFNELSFDLEQLIKELNCFSLDLKNAILGAKLYMKLKGKRQEIEIFDCLIAAIIISNDYQKLVINNQKHFKRFEELELISF